MKRRQFNQALFLMAGGMATTAFAGIPGASAILRRGVCQEPYGREQFHAQIGRSFLVREQGAPDLVLKAVEDVPCSGMCEQFNLIFEPTSPARLEEGIHTLESPDGSRMELFLIPSERGTQTQQLVSIFNLLPVA